MRSQLNKSKQNGAALLVALSFLVVITLISLTTMRSTTTELRLASNNEERVAAEQLAQSAVDAVMSDPNNFIVTGVEGTEDTSVTLDSNDVSEFSHASVTITEGTTANPPRGLGVSAEKFQGTMFHIDGDYNNLDEGRGQAFVGQGIVLLVPKS